MRPANPGRGEAALRVGDADVTLRPSFDALVAAESELGSLFALVDRAADGQMTLFEIVSLFDHLSAAQRPPAITRDDIGKAVVAMGMARCSPILKTVLTQILKGG